MTWYSQMGYCIVQLVLTSIQSSVFSYIQDLVSQWNWSKIALCSHASWPLYMESHCHPSWMLLLKQWHNQIWLCLVELITIHHSSFPGLPMHHPGFDHLQYAIKDWMVGRPAAFHHWQSEWKHVEPTACSFVCSLEHHPWTSQKDLANCSWFA